MIKKLTLSFLSFFFLIQGYSQKVAGGEIYYELIGNKKYLVTAHLYRICEMAALTHLDAYVYGDTLKVPMSFTRISIQRINDTCGNPCNIQNAVSNPGFEKHVFVDTVDFNSQDYKIFPDNNICTIRFGIHQNLRIATVSTHSIGYFFLDASVNICLNITKNRSPIFTIEPKFLMACNQPASYTPGPLDTTDYDSMAFELVNVQIGENTNVTYTNYFNKDIPMTPYCPPNPGVVNCRALPNAKPPRGFYFDMEMCQIALTPSKCDEIATIKFRIKEFRKNPQTNIFELLGYVTREMGVKVKQVSDNNAPYFIGNNKYSVCEEKKLCFYVQAKDEPFLPNQTKLDTVSLFWNYGIPGATFTIIDPTAREKEAQFCWTAKPPEAPGTCFFAVAAYDKQCNINLTSRAYMITTKISAHDSRKYTLTKACNKLLMEAYPHDSIHFNPKNYTYKYTIRDSTNTGIPLYISYKKSDSFTFMQSGKYIIEHEINNPPLNCPGIYFDTLFIPPSKGMLNFNRDTFTCNGDSMTLSPLNLHVDRKFSFLWENPMGPVNPGDTFRTLTFKLQKKKIVLTITDHLNCVLKDTINVGRIGTFDFNFTTIVNQVCKGFPINISAKNIRAQKPYNIEWRLDNVAMNINDTFINESFNSKSTIQLTISDINNCSYMDSLVIVPVEAPGVNIGQDTSVCINTKLSIRSSLSTYADDISYQWFAGNKKLPGIDTFLNYTFTKSEFIKLKITNDVGCTNEDNMLVTTFPHNDFNIVSNTHYNPLNKIVLSTDVQGNTYKWFNGRNTRNDTFWASELGSPGKHKVWCIITDNNGCKTSDTIEIFTDKFLHAKDISENNFSFYPNPVQHELFIDVKAECIVQVMSLEGKVLSEQVLEPGKNNLMVNLLDNGMYLLRIGGKTVVFVKE